jgi:hypothetical protein
MGTGTVVARGEFVVSIGLWVTKDVDLPMAQILGA